MKNWQLNKIDEQLIDLALKEDLNDPFCDITSETIFDSEIKQQARIISKHATSIVLCGIPVLNAIIKRVHNTCEIKTHYNDGDIINPGEMLLTITGPAKVLLMLERTLLNFLQRLSAIATLTHAFAEKIKDTQTKILDTRKTTPGMRHLEKYAVYCGGGVNHRIGLYDAVMIKDTHVDLIGGMSKALACLPAQLSKNMPVIVEVRDLNELDIVLQEGLGKINRVLLDNMTIKQLRNCVAKCYNKIATEASGNITLENITAIAATGVNFASIGKITHSAGIVDLSMKCD